MNIAFLLAAGASRRFRGEKLFAEMGGTTVFEWALAFLENSGCIDEILITANSRNKARIAELVRKNGARKVKGIFLGGRTRGQSVKKLAARACRKIRTGDFFVVHNAANPYATENELRACIEALKKNAAFAGVAVGRRIHATLRHTDAHGAAVLPRENVWEMETPQVVRAREFAHACANFKDRDFTDELAVLEAAGKRTFVRQALASNRKITLRDDYELLRALHIGALAAVGIGEDGHKFLTGTAASSRPLMLGGECFRNLPALKADSDGDVVIHALCNAIASAVGEGSLGTYATPLCRRGVSKSSEFLRIILKKMRARGYTILQSVFSLEAGRPPLEPLIPSIKKSLSKKLKIPLQKIGITATTASRISPEGQGNGIRCRAIVYLQRRY